MTRRQRHVLTTDAGRKGKQMGQIDRGRDAEAARLRANGMTYGQIADRLDYSNASGAFKAAQRHFQRRNAVMTSEVRDLASTRLEQMLAGTPDQPGGILALAIGGDLEAAKLADKLISRQLELHGGGRLRMPDDHEPTEERSPMDRLLANADETAPRVIPGHPLVPPGAFDDDGQDEISTN